jgi:uncharacterized protein YjiS (DUF1127 family)
MAAADLKEVIMDLNPTTTEEETEQIGGSRTRKRQKKARRRTQVGGDMDSLSADTTLGKASTVAVEKAGGGGHLLAPPPPVPTSAPVPTPTPSQAGGGPSPKVVIAPPKKRPPKLLLVPGAKTHSAARAAALQKTFKAHKVRVLIDNTAKTQRRRRQTIQAVEAMTDSQLRDAAVVARLSRRETVEKVPISLLRQMLKDYRMMRGMLI